MVQKITNVVPSETSDISIRHKHRNGRSNYLSDLEHNAKTLNKNRQKLLPDKLASFTPIIVSAIDKFRNIKCKRPDIDAIYRRDVSNCGR